MEERLQRETDWFAGRLEKRALSESGTREEGRS
jgi:hypothetical protein